MRTVSDFEPFVLAYVPYLPQEIIQHAIRESIVEFMRETKIARDTLEVETQEKVPDYIMEMPDCRRIVKIHTVDSSPANCNGRENWQRLRSGECGDYEIELRRGGYPIIVLQDPPKKPHRLRIDYSWTIGRDDCDVPDFIYEDFMQGIVAGTLLRLASLPDQQGLLSQLQIHQSTWFNAIQSAKIERTGGKAKRIIGAPILSRGRGSIWR